VQVVAEWTGQLAYDLRVASRLTVEDFAAKLGLSARGVAKWEANREQTQQIRVQEMLDVLLSRADAGTLARFAQLVARSGAVAREVPAPAVLDVAAPRSAAPHGLDAPANLDAALWLESSLRQLYSADNQLGPRILLPAVTSHITTIEQMQNSARGDLLNKVLCVGAAYAEFAGWLSQDAGDLAQASRWYAKALEWSEAGCDPRIGLFVLMRRAVQAIGDGQGEYAVRLARAAQRNEDDVTLRVRAIAAQTEALAHAAVGDADAVEECLDVARDLTSRTGEPLDGDPTGGGRYCELDLYLQISTAKAYAALGVADRAVEVFDDVLAALPQSFRRDRGQYLARQAEAAAAAGTPERSYAFALEALTIARETGSSRTVEDVRKVITGPLRPWASLPEGRAVRDMLGTMAPPDRKA